MASTTDGHQWRGRTMVGTDGQKIGKITEIYENPEPDTPGWAMVSSGLIRRRSNFVPLAGATAGSGDVRAQVTRDQFKAAPAVKDDADLSEQEERRLLQHYGVSDSTAGPMTVTD